METKICIYCRNMLPFESFYKATSNKDGYGNVCKGCVSLKNRGLLPKMDARNHPRGRRSKEDTIRIALNEERMCIDCGLQKSLSDFDPSPRAKSGYEGTCRSCKEKRAAVPAEPSVCEDEQDAGRTKRCSTCQQILPLSNFGTNAAQPSGYNSKCKPCSKAYMQEYNKKNKERLAQQKKERDSTPEGQAMMAERVRRYRANHPYSCRAQQYRKTGRSYLREHSPYERNEIYERDGGNCQECGTHLAPNMWHLDHYYPFGPDSWENVRVTCGSCNARKSNNEPDGSWVAPPRNSTTELAGEAIE